MSEEPTKKPPTIITAECPFCDRPCQGIRTKHYGYICFCEHCETEFQTA